MPKSKKKERDYFKVGRPPKYKNAAQLQRKIRKYFRDEEYYKVKRLVKTKEGYEEIEVPKITITDLVIYLGFANRQSFYDLENQEEFSDTIKRARSFIEREYEAQLDLNPTGAIFALKNFGWTDRQEIDQNTNLNVKGSIILPAKEPQSESDN